MSMSITVIDIAITVLIVYALLTMFYKYKVYLYDCVTSLVYCNL